MPAILLIFYRIYQVVIMCPLLIVATILTAVATVIGSALGFGGWWGYYPEILWSRLFCWLAFVRVTVSGRENIDSKVSYMFRWMMKQSLQKIPFVGWACRWAKQIFVDNSSPAATRRTMERAERLLSGGMSLVVFPEGARTWTGEMRPFKRGAYRLAVEFNLPVVPLTIDGAFKVLPRFKKLPVPGHIHLTIHKPIHPSTDGHDLSRLMEESRSSIASVL